MKFKFVLGAAAIFAMLASFIGSANAENRFAIGVSGGVANFDTSGTETEGGNIGAADTSVFSTNVSKGVPVANIFAEYATQFGDYGATIGFNMIPGDHSIGKKTRTDTVSDSNEDSSDTGTYIGKASVSEHIGAYIEPTYYFPGTESGIYLKLGALRTTVDTEESIAIGEDSSSYGSDTVWGTQYGIGIRSRSESGFFTKLEYSETDYDSLSFTSTTGNSNKITADIDQQMFTVGIGWSF